MNILEKAKKYINHLKPNKFKEAVKAQHKALHINAPKSESTRAVVDNKLNEDLNSITPLLERLLKDTDHDDLRRLPSRASSWRAKTLFMTQFEGESLTPQRFTPYSNLSSNYLFEGLNQNGDSEFTLELENVDFFGPKSRSPTGCKVKIKSKHLEKPMSLYVGTNEDPISTIGYVFNGVLTAFIDADEPMIAEKKEIEFFERYKDLPPFQLAGKRCDRLVKYLLNEDLSSSDKDLAEFKSSLHDAGFTKFPWEFSSYTYLRNVLDDGAVSSRRKFDELTNTLGLEPNIPSLIDNLMMFISEQSRILKFDRDSIIDNIVDTLDKDEINSINWAKYDELNSPTIDKLIEENKKSTNSLGM